MPNVPNVPNVVEKLLSPGRGTLAVDEHPELLARALGVDRAGSPVRHAFRETVLATPGLDRWVSAVVVDDEALDVGLDPRSVEQVIGVRLGSGTAHFRHAEATERRRDEIRQRLSGYHERGVGFVKWRADLDPLCGPASAYVDTGHLAACARLTLAADLVPVLDVTMPKQRSHGLGVAIAVTANALRSLADELTAQEVPHEHVLVRLNMVRAGLGHQAQTSSPQVGRSTLRVLSTSLSDRVLGVMFMSTGMELEPACAALAAIATEADRTGWRRTVTFGFGRALVHRAVRAWADEGESAAQAALAASCAAAAAALEGAPSTPEREGDIPPVPASP